MSALQSTLLSSKQIMKFTASIAILASMVACGGSPYVESADRNEIITVGDSIYDLSGEIQLFLEQKSGQTFRNYTQSGAKLTGGSLATAVNVQYSDAKAADSNITTMVMNGGGNDILLPAVLSFDPYRCKTTWYRNTLSDKCKALIEDVYVTGVNLLNEMDRDGVENIIYLGYYKTTGKRENLVSAVEYGVDRLTDACANTTANCTFIESRATMLSSDVLDDGIHPTASGSQKLADLIWPNLQPLL
jgi:lysophospholipase L1-like esterase